MRSMVIWLCCCFICIAQEKIHQDDVVECYFELASQQSIIIYESVNGKIVDSLLNSSIENNWYKLAVVESDYGWFKIRDIQKLPNHKINHVFDNYWVKSNNFQMRIKDYNLTKHVYIYDLPTKASNRIHKLDANQEVLLTEVSGLWAKINFTVGKKEIEGWLPFKDQHAKPEPSFIKD